MAMNIFDEIVNDEMNKTYTQNGLKPIYAVSKNAGIVIIGQAPGLKVQNTGIMWNDVSGERLREWMGIDNDIFYTSGLISVIPMDFYYPGKGKSGDLPPRKGIAEKWHSRLLQEMPNVKLVILVGLYAQKYYLHLSYQDTLTQTVKSFKKYLPKYFPIVHPSPRNNIWITKNQWFEESVIPYLQKNVKQTLDY